MSLWFAQRGVGPSIYNSSYVIIMWLLPWRRRGGGVVKRFVPIFFYGKRISKGLGFRKSVPSPPYSLAYGLLCHLLFPLCLGRKAAKLCLGIPCPRLKSVYSKLTFFLIDSEMFDSRLTFSLVLLGMDGLLLVHFYTQRELVYLRSILKLFRHQTMHNRLVIAFSR
ncbi:hypothetical protein F4821DRAFT_91156 [Hypoxylon rubiginosum]|uniref:Uncharacterized protein n=1 Tax=Hypoxylon rubiginosum TaxID=110542 RepID=A0ACC0CIC4_9PEZI|nr:hypothetical protein F4821DRAFT_91156 [Hypoxylon rubiginosum]